MRKPFKLAKGRTHRHVPGQMNKTEQRYNNHLKLRQHAGNILQFGFEELTLKLAKDLRYTPDFWVQLPDGVIEFHEVKGSKKHTVKDKETGAKVKTGKIVPHFFDTGAKASVKMAADKFPFRFVVVFEDKAGGRWLEEEYSEPEPLPDWQIEAQKNSALSLFERRA